MAIIYPTIENILRLKVKPTEGELHLVNYLKDNLDDNYDVFFNPFLDGDRPDIIILKEHVGAFIIEVKDWELNHYDITAHNKWHVSNRHTRVTTSSPHSQAFRYKKNLYDLHLPTLGLSKLTNRNFFNVVHCYVYLHKATGQDVNQLYATAEEKNKHEQQVLNNRFKSTEISFLEYDKKINTLSRHNTNLRRDKSLSITSENLASLVKKIKNKTTHVLFNDDIYKEFKRRLSPPEHTLKQGIKLNLDTKQVSLTISQPGKGKIKGVAGCGKTTILAQRALNAYERHDSPVLILTFNITLKNYIRDKISDLQGCRDFTHFQISNYHQFFNSQINNSGQDLSDLVSQHGLQKLYSTDVFKDKSLPRFATILLDEVQDYEPQWVKIIRDNFLEDDSEMVLFGDYSQNIYQREIGRASVVAQGFGTWNKLNRSYRIGADSPLGKLFKDFQLKYLIEKYSDTEVLETAPEQMGITFELLEYKHINSVDWQEKVFNSISNYTKERNLHTNDIVILSSTIFTVRSLNEYWLNKEKTHCMFETYLELAELTRHNLEDIKRLDEHQLGELIHRHQADIDSARRAKKSHFYANSGLIKLSTVHSYKGLESKTVFYILQEGDSPEIAYTSITRSTDNLVVFDISKDNQYSSFFSAEC